MIASKKKCLIAVITALLIIGTVTVLLVTKPWDTTSNVTRYSRAAVAANGYECAAIGKNILQQGGSAVDAAIAVMFCSGVTCAQCMGLGGGFLATVYDASTGEVTALNARERAPAATTQNMFANASSTVGGLSVAVPGELIGYGELYKRYGKLPWAQLIQPTSDLCRQGHIVNEYMGRMLNSYATDIEGEPSMSEVYVNPETGTVWQQGDTIRLLKLAETLDIIAEEGPEAMHNGSLTAQFVQDIRNFDGIITEDDMRNYRVEWQDAIVVNLTDNHKLYTVPLPGSGSVLAFILNMLRDWTSDLTNSQESKYLEWHRIIESFKYAYAFRSNLGDPSSRPELYELEKNLTDPTFAAVYRSLVDDNTTYSDWSHYGGIFELVEDHGTAHTSIIAADGSAVSLTSTINYVWGARIRSVSTGIILNDEMDDFAIPNRTSVYGLPASPNNMLAPGLQPLSSMTPSIVVDNNGVVDLVIGAAGGTKITTQIALLSRDSIANGEDLADLIVEPRIHHQLLPMEVQQEAGFPTDVLESLASRSHTIAASSSSGFASVTAISRDSSGLLEPLTDPRRVGSVDGF